MIPSEALTKWVERFTELLATKRGLASALHSGDPEFEALPEHFMQCVGPALTTLLDAAVAAGAISDDLDAEGLLYAIAQLCQPVPGRGFDHNQLVGAVLLDGPHRDGRPETPRSRRNPAR